MLSRKWFPNRVSGSSQRIRDWFGNTVELDAPSTADDPDNANHPYGAVLMEVLKFDDVVNRVMHSVSLSLMEQTMSGDFYSLATLDFRWYIACCTRIVYNESGCNDASLDNLLTCVNSSKLIGALFNIRMSESVGTCKKRATETYFGGLGYAYVRATSNKVSQEISDTEIERA